jgi:hypothetical protein
MNYDKLLEELVKNVDFEKYDAFSTSKYCHYTKVGSKDVAFIWCHYDNKELLDRDSESFKELQKRINEAKKRGARLPGILSVLKSGDHLFQLQERVMGKKLGYYEILAEKTRVEDFIEVLKTIDIMAETGINVDQGYNCLVDDEGHINLLDCYLTLPKQFRVNARPYLFHDMIFREPQYPKEEDIKVLIKILRKLVKACAIYFNENNLDRETIYKEIMNVIKNYSFISMEDKDKLINEILDETLQITK